MTQAPFAATTPMFVSKVGLKARDAQGLADYYTAVVGLLEISRRQGVIVLGAGETSLLEIEEVKSGCQDDPRSAGLFHTAFLLPDRGDLARWAHHAIDQRFQIEGASDHLVSEAIYLTDPEGNGIEIYTDREPHVWRPDGKNIKMATDSLNVGNLFSTYNSSLRDWKGAPAGTMIGHVHLRVGNAQEAEAWWQESMNFDTAARYGEQAVFLSTGGYHHHIAANVWHSRNAAKRDIDCTGLNWIELKSQAGVEKSVQDPWGIDVRVVG